MGTDHDDLVRVALRESAITFVVVRVSEKVDVVSGPAPDRPGWRRTARRRREVDSDDGAWCREPRGSRRGVRRGRLALVEDDDRVVAGSRWRSVTFTAKSQVPRWTSATAGCGRARDMKSEARQPGRRTRGRGGRDDDDSLVGTSGPVTSPLPEYSSVVGRRRSSGVGETCSDVAAASFLEERELEDLLLTRVAGLAQRWTSRTRPTLRTRACRTPWSRRSGSRSAASARSCPRMPLTVTASRSFVVLTSSTAAAAELTGTTMAAAITQVSNAAFPRTNASKQDNLHP